MIAGLTANTLEQWSDNREAQEKLPDLVRRLLAAAGRVRYLSMPAGDSINQPGVDGRIIYQGSHPFIPDGESVWEMGCTKDVRKKANDDYHKRTDEYPEHRRKQITYVQVTPRRWRGKEEWIEERRKEGNWKDVKALDADNLEMWLQQHPTVALQVAEWLGLAGPGVCSPESHFRSWAAQCEPAIRPETFLVGRDGEIQALVQELGKDNLFINVVADSAEEAAAFAAIVTAQCMNLASKTMVVTSPEEWHLARSNPGVSILIAADAKVARSAPHMPGCTTIIPASSGHLLPGSREPTIKLERLPIHEFSESLQLAGLGEADAEREGRACGRSWTVFRRLHAQNQAIATPAWVDELRKEGLQFLVLVSAWDESREDDWALIELLAGRPHEEIERILDRLAHADDSTVARAGSVWKARSPHELFRLLASALRREDIDNFLQLAEDVLSERDPRLDVPPEDRWFAQVLGKERPFSGILYEALLNGLVMLSVLPDQMEGLPSQLYEARFHVHELVRRLLHNADADRWQSVADWLPWLAEAAPEAFLSAVEAALRDDDSPLVHLMSATEGQEVFESVSRTGFLWAMELLAWSPAHVARVAKILVHLSTIPLNDNWVNRPAESLTSIFRPWYPQTSLDLERRRALLDKLAEQYPEVVFEVVANQVIHMGQDTATPNYKPRWRDWASGDPFRVTTREYVEALRHTCTLALELARGNAERLGQILRSFGGLVRNFPDLAADMLEAVADMASSGTDEERELLRTSARQILHRYSHFADDIANADSWRTRLEDLHDRLTPRDLVVRHAWLFSNHVELPLDLSENWQEEEEQILEWRKTALEELLSRKEWLAELGRLLDRAKAPWVVGNTFCGILESDDALAEMVDLLLQEIPLQGRWLDFAEGFLRSLSDDELSRVLNRLANAELPAEYLVNFLVACPFVPEVWGLAENHSEEATTTYWQKCNPWIRDLSRNDLVYALKRLMDAGRAEISLDAAKIRFAELPSEVLLSLLQETLASGDDRLDRFAIVCALEVLENSSLAGSEELAQLEFPLVRAFELDNLQQIPTLTHFVMNSPEEFVNLLCLLHSCRETENKEADENAASLVWSFLRSCAVQPGQKRDGSIPEEDFRKFIEESIALATEHGIEDKCRYWVGEILARGPAGRDDIIPFEPARDALEILENEPMRRGFMSGRRDARGMVSRGAYEGGEQELKLEQQYRKHAKALQISHPNVAAMLNRLADTYRDEAMREDERASMRRETG